LNTPLNIIANLGILSLVSPAVAYALSPDFAADKSQKSQEMILLTVDKSRNQADLRTLPEDLSLSRVLKTFKIATGKAEGDKERQGDNKTPEGIYFTLGTIPSKQLAPEKYGPLAIPLNFPNPMDQASGKTGYGIWLHGVGGRRIEDARVTEGCVAFQNNEITTLTQWLQPNHGIVVIARDSSEVNKANDVEDVLKASRAWLDAWASRDVGRYIDFYADDFNNNGKGKSAYEAYKKAVFASYRQMSVKMTNIRVVTHSKYALALMNQEFNGDNRFRSDGRKMIYLRRGANGTWKIVREMFDNFMMRPVQFSTEDVAGLNKGAAITRPGTSSEVSAKTSENLSL
jgi:murein L,D-transpeptidase YafK